jgi:MFS family permease
MGLYGSALTLGLAGGAPLAGVVIDMGGPSWGFAVVGAVTLAVALLVLPFTRTRDRAAVPGKAALADAPPGAESPDDNAEVVKRAPAAAHT